MSTTKKADGTYNVKYIVYHKGGRIHIDSPHFVSQRHITKEFEIKDKVLLGFDETLGDYRKLMSELRSKANFLTCEELRDYLKDFDKEIDIVEFANLHIDYLKKMTVNLIQEHSGKFATA